MSNGLSVTNNASLPATEGQGRRTDESQLHLQRTISSDRRNRNLHGCGQQNGKLHAGNGLLQNAPHHLEEPAH